MRQGLMIGGAILFAVGLAALTIGGVVFTRDETVLQVGDMKIETERKDSISVPSVGAVLAMGAGLIFVLVGFTRQRG